MRNRRINSFLIGVLIAFTQITGAGASSRTPYPVSPFNKIQLIDTVQNFSFIVSGHFHGASTNASTYPASTLLANIDTLNSLNPLFLMSLGDLFLDVNQTSIDHYQKSLFSKLKMPLFNAVGNHDLSNGGMYTKVFGDTRSVMVIGMNVFITLNSEQDDGSIKGDQLEFLKSVLAGNDRWNGYNIFIFTHRPVWAENNEKYKGLFEGNTRTVVGTNNYQSEIEPLLLETKSSYIFWFSGSMASAPVSFFYDKNPETGIAFIQTAIRDLPRDAVLQVNVTGTNVSFKGISLTGQNIEQIENYGIEYWKKEGPQEEKFSYRLVPYLILKMVSHHYFWVGSISTIIFILLLRFILKRWKKRK